MPFTFSGGSSYVPGETSIDVGMSLRVHVPCVRKELVSDPACVFLLVVGYAERKEGTRAGTSDNQIVYHQK